METTPEVKCPKCGSNQITANKKGFSGGKALAGAVLTGGIGLLAGAIGKDKIIITCLACGNQFGPGEVKKVESTYIKPRKPTAPTPQIPKPLAYFIIAILVFILFIMMVVLFSGK